MKTVLGFFSFQDAEICEKQIKWKGIYYEDTFTLEWTLQLGPPAFSIWRVN